MNERLRELLLKAVRTLEPAERDEVLSELLIVGTSHAAAPFMSLATPHGGSQHAAGRLALTEELSNTLAVASGEVKVLPVRLPAADYERLRAWSREHGFSMAVIIRTLVERFLDGQQAQPPSAVKHGSPTPD